MRCPDLPAIRAMTNPWLCALGDPRGFLLPTGVAISAPGCAMADSRLLAAGAAAMPSVSRRPPDQQPGTEPAPLPEAVPAALAADLGLDAAPTQWWTRTDFAPLATMEIARSDRYRYGLTLILLEIDDLIDIERMWGAPVASSVLATVARKASERCRAGDLRFRWSPCQLAVVVPFCTWRGGASMAEDLRWLAADSLASPGLHCSCSAGVAEHLPGESLQDWVGRTELQLQGAIRQGRNRVNAAPTGGPEAETGVVQLVWRDAYASGHERIDEQHIKLFRLANRVLEAAVGDLQSDAAQESLLCELDLLLGHVAEHFRDEEAVLEGRRYSRLKQHRLAHKSLLERAQRLRDRVQAGRADLGELTDFLAREVIVRHMLGADREYFPVLRKGK